jgi:hypothetical protein
VATFYGPLDADWAACLMLDLRARGVEVWDYADPPGGRAAIAAEGGALLVVRSHRDGLTRPTAAEVSAVAGRNGPYVMVVLNSTKVAINDHPPLAQRVNLLEDDPIFYQPTRSAKGAGEGGFAHLLNIFLGPSPTLDLPDGHVFISYCQADEEFVKTRLRPCLAREGYPSWDYRWSERVLDRDPARRLDELVTGASALVVVATAAWHVKWTDFELAVARWHGRPVVAVRPAAARPSSSVVLGTIPVQILDGGQRTAPGVAAALRGVGIGPFGEA